MTHHFTVRRSRLNPVIALGCLLAALAFDALSSVAARKPYERVWSGMHEDAGTAHSGARTGGR